MPKSTLKLTPEVQDKIVRSINAGAWFATAAEAAGVSRETAKGWRKLGEGFEREVDGKGGKWVRVADEGPEPYLSFARAVTQAIGKANERDEQLLAKHGLEDWRAAAYRLERRNPLIFGAKARLEHTGKGGGPIETRGSASMTPAELLAYAARLHSCTKE